MDKELFKSLSPEMKQCVKPFLGEHKTLCKGVWYDIRIGISFSDSEDYIKNTIRVKFYWESDCKATCLFNNKKMTQNGSYEFWEWMVENSPQIKEFNERIVKFILDTEEVGLEQFKDKDALWNAYFGNCMA